jgi:regulator of protease activity HflC (stomatin/prohibitin superfamily)
MRRLAWSVVALGLMGCGVVSPGERAVFAHWGAVEPKCYKEGLYFYNFFTTDMYELDAKVQAVKFEKLTAASRDLQDVHSDVVVNFSIDGEQCHELLKNVGRDFLIRVIQPAVAEILKASTAHFTVEGVIRERVALKTEIEKGLRDRLAPYHIVMHHVNLVDFGFSQTYSAAIEQKQVQEQNVQRAEFMRQQAVKEAEARVARADGDAKANRLMAESLRQSPEALEFKRLEVQGEAVKKWNGTLPQYTGGGAIPFIGVGVGGGGGK